MRVTAVRTATKADLDGVCTSLAKAFSDDPVMLHLLPPSTPKRERRLALLMRMEAGGALRHGALWSAADGRANAVWKPPGKWRVGGAELVRQMPQAVNAFRGRIGLALAVVNEIERHHPTEPHWYLAVLGTEPEAQGKGHGSAAMTPVLDHCDREGEAAFLESSKEQNIPFYERHGFVVTGEVTLARGGPTVWPMWRDPR